jgi:hypothetical protein
MVTIDLLAENGVEIGASYKASFQVCGMPDLQSYTGVCQIRTSNTDTTIILSPVVEISTKDVFSIGVNFLSYPSTISPGTYQYDVLFTKTDNTDRFYAVGGKIQIIKRITRLP